MPAGADPALLGRVQAEAVTDPRRPARRLQALAATAGLDEAVFLNARFDADGGLLFDGLIGDESQRRAAAGLVDKPEITADYARPDGRPPADPAAAVAKLAVVPWKTRLLTGMQARFARPSNKGTDQQDLRYCRLDGARFAYRDSGGLQLRIEGILLADDDPATATRLVTPLRDEAGRLFLPGMPVDYTVVNDLKPVSNPLRALRAKVAGEPSADGVRLDDLVIGPKGLPTLEGVWLGESQAQALDSLLAPVLSERTGGKVGGPLAHEFTVVPTDLVLRDLRAKTSAASDETSLERLSFQPAKDDASPPVPTLKGSTYAPNVQAVSAKLNAWLSADPRLSALGAGLASSSTSAAVPNGS